VQGGATHKVAENMEGASWRIKSKGKGDWIAKISVERQGSVISGQEGLLK
jgi:hypothetical protein